MRHDVLHLVRVLGREGHARVAHVGDAGDGGVQVRLGEGGGEEQEGSAHGGEEVDLVGEAYARVVAEDLDGLLKASGEIEGIPLGEVSAEGIEVDDAVFDQGTVHRHVRVKVHACAPVILNP